MNEHLAIKRSLQLQSIFGKAAESSKDLLVDQEPKVRYNIAHPPSVFYYLLSDNIECAIYPPGHFSRKGPPTRERHPV